MNSIREFPSEIFSFVGATKPMKENVSPQTFPIMCAAICRPEVFADDDITIKVSGQIERKNLFRILLWHFFSSASVVDFHCSRKRKKMRNILGGAMQLICNFAWLEHFFLLLVKNQHPFAEFRHESKKGGENYATAFPHVCEGVSTGKSIKNALLWFIALACVWFV